MSILEAVAMGYNTPKKIGDHISVPQQSIPKYLGELKRIRLLKHSLPVTERHTRSRKGIYELSDNYFDFWFSFIAPNMADVKDDPENFVKYKVMDDLDRYTGRKFEDVCIEYVRKSSLFSGYSIIKLPIALMIQINSINKRSLKVNILMKEFHHLKDHEVRLFGCNEVPGVRKR